jgi:2-oxoglutarate ferredoxin oxidoreductase subunit alpha
VRECALKTKFVAVVEMNLGQLVHSVKLAVDDPDRVFLINRFDGELITDADIKKTLRIITGRGV